MVLEREILPYFQWLLTGEGSFGALPRYLIVLAVISGLALLLGYVIAAARHGLVRGGDVVYRTVSASFREMLDLSPRRIWALASLAMKEAWRRRVIVALVVFCLILLFAGLFLKTDDQNPAKLYVSFVLTATTYLVLGVALLLSAFSLPGDFKNKTIYTVVTKPVRAGEIILGRMIGFSLVGTILLALMAIFSYVFVLRSLDHDHRIDHASLKRMEATGETIESEGRTSRDSYHRHSVLITADEGGSAFPEHGHEHKILAQGDRLQVLPPQNLLQARVPQWGKLRFISRQGVDKSVGISVGSEWTYRSFIDGGSQAAAIWTFKNIQEANHPDGLNLGLIVRVFRTHKGIIGRPIFGQIQVRNPETGLRSEPTPFGALDAQVDEQDIPRKLLDTDNNTIDLFEDLVSKEGEVEIWIQCLERGQYYGFAQADCFLRLPDASPLWNYAKVYLSIWVQMVIVTAIGVAVSALVSGPVALLFTVSFILLGFFRQFIIEVALGPNRGGVHGGGPLESLVRIVTQKNVITPLDPGTGTSLVKGVDGVLEFLMINLARVLPDFSSFSTVDFAALGFDVPTERVMQDLTTCLGFVVGLAVMGYFFLRTREIAK